MNVKNNRQFIAVSAIVIVFLIALIILIILRNKGKLSIGGRFAMSSFKRRLLDNADAEFQKWNYGKTKEQDPSMLPTLEKYWQHGAGVNYKGAVARNNAWSAAAISYLMKTSGSGDDFPYAASHSTYITRFILARKNNTSSPFKGYRVNEVAVEPGDLVCYSRNNSSANYDTVGSYESHCDLVVEKESGSAESRGGNVSNSFSKTIVPLTDQDRIDLSRTSKPYFVVIKNSK